MTFRFPLNKQRKVTDFIKRQEEEQCCTCNRGKVFRIWNRSGHGCTNGKKTMIYWGQYLLKFIRELLHIPNYRKVCSSIFANIMSPLWFFPVCAPAALENCDKRRSSDPTACSSNNFYGWKVPPLPLPAISNRTNFEWSHRAYKPATTTQKFSNTVRHISTAVKEYIQQLWMRLPF